LINVCGYFAYVDQYKKWIFQPKGSVYNYDEAITDEYNLIEVGEFKYDTTELKNKIKVYGGEVKGIKLLYTAEDIDSQNSYGIKELNVENNNLIEYSAIVEYGEQILELKKDPILIGEFNSVLLSSIQPGELIFISSDSDDVDAAYYEIISYKHSIGENSFESNVFINKESLKIEHVITDSINTSIDQQNKIANLDNLEFSYPLFFEDSLIGTFTNTLIDGNSLKLITGNSNGSWVSPVKNTTNIVSKAKLQLIGDTLSGITISVSFNNGLSYQLISNNETITPLNSGTEIKILINIANTSSSVFSLNLLYK